VLILTTEVNYRVRFLTGRWLNAHSKFQGNLFTYSRVIIACVLTDINDSDVIKEAKGITTEKIMIMATMKNGIKIQQ
jgi:hypothetical protein